MDLTNCQFPGRTAKLLAKAKLSEQNQDQEELSSPIYYSYSDDSLLDANYSDDGSESESENFSENSAECELDLDSCQFHTGSNNTRTRETMPLKYQQNKVSLL